MELTKMPDDTIPTLNELTLEQVMRIDKLLEVGGAMDITIEGTILDIKEGSGLILRCNECKRVLRNGECMVHGSQSGTPDLRIKAVVDDGSGAIMVVLNSEITTRILNKTVEECTAEVTEKGPGQLEEIFNEISENLMLQPIRVNGNVTTDDFGAMMIASTIDEIMISDEVSTEAKELLEIINSGTWRSEVV
jgi:replication factor A1